MDFVKCQHRFGQFSLFKKDSTYLDVKLKVLKEDDNKEFRLVKNLTMGEADFKQFMRLRKQLVNAAEHFAREENLTSVLIPTMSKDMDEQLKLAHKVVDALDRANRKICVTPLQVQCGQAWQFLCSSSIFCREEGGRENSTSCLCEL